MGLNAPLRLRAPAKLNLFLHVIGRRPDGYHEIQTFFQLIDFYDEVEILPNSGPWAYADDAPGGLGAEHLCLRAYRALRARHPDAPGVAVRLRKRIFVGAGLGGGSSDAAAVLHGLNRFWNLGYRAAELARLGAELGADVPLFVHGRTAFAEGAGERLTPRARPPGTALVLPPPAPLSSADAYAALEDGSLRPRIAPAQLDAHWGSNAFEAWARAREPEIGARLDWLRARAPAALTGAGGAVFAWCAARAEAAALLAQCPPSWGGVLARGLDRSPLPAAAA